MGEKTTPVLSTAMVRDLMADRRPHRTRRHPEEQNLKTRGKSGTNPEHECKNLNREGVEAGLARVAGAPPNKKLLI